jgi:hypothetical protein
MLQSRRAAMLEAEFLVMKLGSEAAAHANTLASDPLTTDERRAYYRRVARIARRRYDFFSALDTATKYDVANEWRGRRGALHR